MRIPRIILLLLLCTSIGRAGDIRQVAELKIPAGPGEKTMLSAAFSPDGKTIATGHQDHLVRIWDAASGALLHAFSGQHHYVQAIAYSPDGKLIATGGYMSKAFVLFDARSGRVILDQQANDDRAIAVAFSPDGKKVVCGGGGGLIAMWDVQSLQKIGEFKGDGGWELSFSPDGKLLASVGTRCIHLFDSQSALEIGRVNIPRGVNGHLAFSPDGRSLAMACNQGVIVWEMASGKPRRIMERPREARGVFMHPGGRFAATASHDRVHILDLYEGKEINALLAGEGGWVYAVAFSPDGARLMCGGGRVNGKVWDVSQLCEQKQIVKLQKQELGNLWEQMANEDAGKACDAVVALAAGDAEALIFLRKQVEVALHPDPKELSDLVAKLDSDQFVEREKAAAALVKFGGVAEPVLEKVLATNPSPQVRSAIEDIRARARHAAASAQELRLLRTIEVWEMANSPEARSALKDLKTDWPRGKVRDAAEETMGRMAIR